MSEKELKRLKRIFIIMTVVFSVIVLGLSIYIATNEDKKKEPKDIDDISLFTKKAINGSNDISYRIDDDSSWDLTEDGISIKMDKVNNSVELTIDWDNDNECVTHNLEYEGIKTSVISFDKKLKEVTINGFGLSCGDERIFYLFEDGTVEYTDLGKYLENNYSEELISFGDLGISNIVELKSAARRYTGNDPYALGGYGYTVVAIKEDGTFYDLDSLIRSIESN